MTKLFCAAILVTTIWAQAQTFTVLHNFTGGADGAIPDAVSPSGRAGVLYGTAHIRWSGRGDWHSVQAKTRSPSGSLTPLLRLYSGAATEPTHSVPGDHRARMASYCGTTECGGAGERSSVSIATSARRLAKLGAVLLWTKPYSTAYRRPPDDGALPGYVHLVFDQAGDIYGTTSVGGEYGDGTSVRTDPLRRRIHREHSS